MAKMTKRERELRKLAGLLAKDFTIQRTRNDHYRIIIKGEHGSRAIIASASPSDARGEKNLKAQIARAILAVSTVAPYEEPIALRKRR